ncbi:MAG: cold shock domain-containing protein [Candidatus Promineofilum sp.]|uniref:cold shock domain-containing protein n=1 Tax=Promineifilum sp. TaxID=2664178 RepID=UPI0024121118|nr:cold shock domain-containing protein [Promineifilum sp.]
MNFRDRWAEKENGERFVFTVEMQRRLSQAGLPIDPSALDQLGTVERQSQPTRYERREQSEPEPRAPESSSRSEERSSSPRSGEIVGPETIQIDPMTGKYVGRVKWYNTKKGYGFIVRGAGEEIFFHKSATVGEVEEFDEGQWILYDVETTAKGPEATDVEPYLGEPLE